MSSLVAPRLSPHSLLPHRVRTCRALRACQLNTDMAPPLSTLAGVGHGRVLSIQSHTVQGYVGNKAAVFPLQLLGFDVDPINSVQFSNHTGYPVWRGQVLNGEELWNLIEGLEANDLLYYTHLLTGYIGSLSFLECVLRVVEKLRSVNPDLIYVCDPVMGDEGTFYIPQNLVPVYSEKQVHHLSDHLPVMIMKVLQLASIVTPNQFEAEKLTGCSIKTEGDALEACKLLHSLGPSKVVITSLEMNGNLLLIGSSMKAKDEPPEQFRISMSKIPEYFTGTGDLMTALILGWSHKYPGDLEKATELAVSSLQGVLKRTVADYLAAKVRPCVKQLELRLIQCQDEIKAPQVTHFAEKYT